MSLHPGEELQITLEGRRLVLECKSPRGARLARGKFGRLVLVACAWQSHVDHGRANRWLERARSFGSKDITDAHLVRLARRHRLKPAALDATLCARPWALGVAEQHAEPVAPSA